MTEELELTFEREDFRVRTTACSRAELNDFSATGLAPRPVKYFEP